MYKAKRQLLVDELKKVFNDKVSILGNLTGIHLIAKFSDYHFMPQIYDKFNAFGIKIHPIDKHTIRKGLYDDTLMLGYGNLSDDDIIVGVKRMKVAFMSLFNNIN